MLLSDSAVARPMEIGALRVVVEGGGCSGFQYKFPEELHQVVLYVNEEETAVVGCGPPGGPARSPRSGGSTGAPAPAAPIEAAADPV
jgi:hypothetical protein